VCGASGPGRGAVLVILNDGGGYAAASLSVNVISVTAGPGPGQLLAWVQPTYFSAVGPEPVEFWCGRFSYRLQLNNHVIQPISALNLISNSASGTGGTCSGVLTLEIWLEFTPASIGPTVRVARTLKLDITGRWTLLDTGRTFPGTSPLLLFAESRAEGTVADPVWVGGDDPNTWLYFEGPVVAGPPSF
nr:hypothetical protein [Thermoanaerobaculia bacterium]